MDAKKTRRIEHFFKSVSPSPSHYRIFFVDWSQQPYRAEWRCDSFTTTIADFECDVVWKEVDRVIAVQCVLPTVDPVIVVTNTSVGEGAPKEERPLYQDKTLVSLLKSNLQKCIRRQLPQKACQTARYLMELDITLLVRRLAIIMLEDVVLHESFSLLAWLTAALSKQFHTPPFIKEWLLGLVDYMCRQHREHYWSLCIDNTLRHLNDLTTLRSKYREICNIVQQPDRQEYAYRRNLAFSLLFRMSYGGLPGDISMLYSFIDKVVLLDGDNTNAIIDKTPIKPLSLDSVNMLDVAQVEPSAVDFHCAPNVIFALSRLYKRFTQQQLKSAIWHHSSKLNKRVIYPKHENDCKDLHRDCFLAIARKLMFLQQEHVKACANTVTYGQYHLDCAARI